MGITRLRRDYGTTFTKKATAEKFKEIQTSSGKGRTRRKGDWEKLSYMKEGQGQIQFMISIGQTETQRGQEEDLEQDRTAQGHEQ